MTSAGKIESYPQLGRASYILGLLSAGLVLSYIDRQIITVLVEPIKHDLALSDTAIGALQGVALMLFLGAVSIPASRLADSWNRRNLAVGSILGWSVFTCICGAAQNYWQLFSARIGVGVCEAVFIPVIFSLIADLFEPKRRVNAVLAYLVFGLIGGSAGMISASAAFGQLTQHTADQLLVIGNIAPWRATFVLVGMPGLVLALLFLTFPEPRRLGLPAIPMPSTGVLATFVRHRRTYLLFGAGVLFMTISTSAIINWIVPILMRSHGVSVNYAGVRVSAVAGVGSLLGIALSALVNRFVRRRRGDAQILDILIISGVIASPMLLVFWRASTPVTALIGFGSFFCLYNIGGALWTPLALTLSPASCRAQIMTLFAATTIWAEGLQMVMVGSLSDHAFSGANGLLNAAFTVSISGLLLSAACFVAARKPLAASAREVEPVTALNLESNSGV